MGAFNLCLKNENIMEELFLQLEGIHLRTYIERKESEMLHQRALFMRTIETIDKASDIFIGFVDIYNQRNSEIYGPRIKFR